MLFVSIVFWYLSLWLRYTKLKCILLSSASKCGVETKTIQADFSAVDIYSKIEGGLTGLEIGVLGKTAGGAEASSLFTSVNQPVTRYVKSYLNHIWQTRSAVKSTVFFMYSEGLIYKPFTAPWRLKLGITESILYS